MASAQTIASTGLLYGRPRYYSPDYPDAAIGPPVVQAFLGHIPPNLNGLGTVGIEFQTPILPTIDNYAGQANWYGRGTNPRDVYTPGVATIRDTRGDPVAVIPVHVTQVVVLPGHQDPIAGALNVSSV